MADRWGFGSKPGSAGVASAQQANIDRRERLRQLALETIDLDKVILLDVEDCLLSFACGRIGEQPLFV